MTISQLIILITIICYLAAMVGIGVGYSKKNAKSDDFYLGGRKLGPFVTVMSAEASDMSGWLLMGLPAIALMCGLPEASWTAIGLAIVNCFWRNSTNQYEIRTLKRINMCIICINKVCRNKIRQTLFCI